MKKAFVFRHLPYEGLGSLEATLHGEQYEVNYIDMVPGSLKNFDPLAPDLLIALGGPIGANEETDYPFLIDEIAQLMARALGAKVYPGEQEEIGWMPIQLTEAGKDSALSHLQSEPKDVVFHWHGDTFDLPEGAVHLASSSRYPNQAFTLGDFAIGLQFHPEVTADNLEKWFIAYGYEMNNIDLSVKQLRKDSSFHAKGLEVRATKFLKAWLHELSYLPQEECS